MSEAEYYAESGLDATYLNPSASRELFDSEAFLETVPAIMFAAWLRGANKDEMMRQIEECFEQDVKKYMGDYEPRHELTAHEKSRFLRFGAEAAKQGYACEPWRHTDQIACRFEAYAAAHAYRTGYQRAAQTTAPTATAAE